MTLEKIQKVLARIGLGSRREIECWIKDARILVNGEIAEIGQRITSSDELKIDGKKITVNFSVDDLTTNNTIIYNKPIGEVCSRKDEQDRKTVFANLPRLVNQRWINVGRLDINTSGLLIFTTDGELAHRLMHPSSQIKRVYHVRINGNPSVELLVKLKAGFIDNGDFIKCTAVKTLAKSKGLNRWFEMTLTEGKNREVRRLWKAIGFEVNRLLRVQFGSIILPKQLKPGCYTYLSAKQLESLKQLVNL